MTETNNTAMGISRFLLWFLILSNLAIGAAIVLGFAATFVFEAPFARLLHNWLHDLNVGLAIPTLRVWMILALPGIGAVHLMLRRGLDILSTVRLGQAFAAENAGRLRTIAWCLVALQVLHLVNGIMVRIAETAHAHMDWDFSLTGWLAAFLVFVLAQVFEQGARMRDDLEAMI